MSTKESVGSNEPIKSDSRTGRYGIKAYGKWFCFNSKRAYKKYLTAWMSGTGGSERDRAVDAFVALWNNQSFWDSDTCRL